MGESFHSVRISANILMYIPVKKDADLYSEESQAQALPYLLNKTLLIEGPKCYLRDLAQHLTSHLHLNTNCIDSLIRHLRI